MNSYQATLYKGADISHFDLIHPNIHAALVAAEKFGKIYDCDKVEVKNVDPKKSTESDYIVKSILKFVQYIFFLLFVFPVKTN